MIEDVLDGLTLNVDSQTKLNLMKEAVISYCIEEKQVFNCYRNLKNLELELFDLLDEHINAVHQEIIKKILKIIKTELEILKVRMRIARVPEDIGEHDKNSESFHLQWTDSKTDLVELIYSIKSSIGDGKVSIKQIAASFEHFFEIKLGNIYDTMNEISLRKLNRSRYIDKITVNFQKVLEQMDS